MGLPEGGVTAVPGLPYAAQIRALGNGVVPAQAAAALRLLAAITSGSEVSIPQRQRGQGNAHAA